MRGIDIIEAMENIDEKLVIDAKLHKKSAPAWLKYLSVAACICCVLLLSLLMINRIISLGEENVPDTLAPTEESAQNSGIENPQPENTITLSSTRYPVTLTVPESYADHVLVDTPFIDDTLYEAFDIGVDVTASFENVAFSYHAYFSEQSASDGMVWLIVAYPIEEFSFEVYEQQQKGVAMVLTHTVIGTDDEYVYEIVHPGYPEYFYDCSTLESTKTYLQHLQAGLTILEDFSLENGLETDPDWSRFYQEFTIAPVEYQLAKHEKAAASKEDDTDAATDNSLEAEDTSDFRNVLFSYGTVHTSEENRINNLQLACDAINGTVLQPGDTFSFNDIVGERTAEKGYKEATVYTTRDDTLVFGGGISQVTSTLYYCCLYADLEIVERQGQIFHDAFIPGGMDAAVYWGSVDFQFKNSTDGSIRIDAYLSEGRVWIELLGIEEPQFKVDLEQERTESESETIYKITRHVYDLDGNLIRTDTTEDLDAMGGLGTTVYAIQRITTAAEEPAAVPAAEVSEYPAYVVMEEDLVFAGGVTLCMTPSEVISILGTPLTDEIYGENDIFRMLDYDGAYCVFQYCEACDTYQLIVCCVDGENAPNMPLGLSYGMSVQEALACFNAEDAQHDQNTTLYRYDDSHWASYGPVADTGLVGIQIIVGEDLCYLISFDRYDQIYSISFEFCVGSLICPYAS